VTDDAKVADDLSVLGRLLGALPDPDRRDEWDAVRDELLLETILESGTVSVPALSHPPRPADRDRRTVTRPAARRVTRIRTWRSVGALCALAVVMTVLVPSQDLLAAARGPQMLNFAVASPDDLAAGSAPSASNALLALAGAAQGRVEPASAGPVQYVEIYGWYSQRDDKGTQVFPTHLRSWLSSDGSRLIRTARDAALQDLSSAGGQVPDTAVPFDKAVDHLPAGSVAQVSLDHLPRTPSLLRKSLLAASPPGACESVDLTAQCLVQGVIALHSSYVVPPDLDAALWQVLADDPGVRLLGSVIDRRGRSGVAVAYAVRWAEQTEIEVLIIDERDGALLATEIMLYPSGSRVAEIRSLSLLLDARWVEDIGAP